MLPSLFNILITWSLVTWSSHKAGVEVNEVDEQVDFANKTTDPILQLGQNGGGR